jgi:hypothetical protein
MSDRYDGKKIFLIGIEGLILMAYPCSTPSHTPFAQIVTSTLIVRLVYAVLITMT